MDTPTAKIKSVSIIKVENGYVVSALGKSHVAKNADEIKTLIMEKLPEILTELEKEPVEEKKSLSTK